MLITNAYTTTYGKLIAIKKIETELLSYLARNDDNLSYEYANTGTTKIIYITGYNLEEKNLPIWDHPVVIKDMRGNTLIVSDLRKYVFAKDELALNISDIIRDSNGVEFVTLRAMLTRDFIDNRIGLHRNLYKSISSAMCAWIVNAMNGIVGLDPVEKAYLEVVITHYVNYMLVEQDEVKNMEAAITGRILKSNYSLSLTNSVIESILSKLNNEVTSISDLIYNIKTVLPEAKSVFITVDTLVNNIANTWYGHGNSETLIMALEHIPTMMTLIYVNCDNKSYKRTQLASIIENNKKRIGNDDYVKQINSYIRDNLFRA